MFFVFLITGHHGIMSIGRPTLNKRHVNLATDPLLAVALTCHAFSKPKLYYHEIERAT